MATSIPKLKCRLVKLKKPFLSYYECYDEANKIGISGVGKTKKSAEENYLFNLTKHFLQDSEKLESIYQAMQTLNHI